MDLTIGAGVTYIGSNAFNEMGGLRNITAEVQPPTGMLSQRIPDTTK